MRRALVVIGLCVAALPGVAEAQAPACSGAAAAAAQAALAEGDAAVERATAALRRRRATEANAAWREALAAYDRACDAGALDALERRAIPLFRLERGAEAAQSLDAFVARHEGTLDSGVQARVENNMRAIERAIATVIVRVEPASAHVLVDGASHGSGPSVQLRLAARRDHSIEIAAPGHETHRETTSLARGARREIEVRLVPVGSGGGAPVVVAIGPTAAVPATPAAAASPVMVIEQRAIAPGTSPAAAVPYSPPIGLAIWGGVLGAAAIALSVPGILLLVDAQGTTSILRDLQLGLGTAFVVLASGALIASVSLFTLFATSGPPSPQAAWARCGASPLGAGCAGRF